LVENIVDYIKWNIIDIRNSIFDSHLLYILMIEFTEVILEHVDIVDGFGGDHVDSLSIEY